MIKYCLFLPLFLLSSCAGLLNKPHLVILQDPTTMEFENCPVQKLSTENPPVYTDECVQKFQKLGYIIWGER